MKNTLAGGLKLTTDEYLDTEETNRPFELVWGVVREPPAPRWDHQTIVLRLATALDQHVRQLGIGKVGMAPLDVVLDAKKHLILQPDLLVIMADRLDIIDRQVWGAPDLVIEVLSPESTSYDRREKRRWYGKYGVREEWIVDPVSRVIDVINLAASRPSTFAKATVDKSTTAKATVDKSTTAKATADKSAKINATADTSARINATADRSARANAATDSAARTFGEDEVVESVVLPSLRLRVATVFEE